MYLKNIHLNRDTGIEYFPTICGKNVIIYITSLGTKEIRMMLRHSQIYCYLPMLMLVSEYFEIVVFVEIL